MTAPKSSLALKDLSYGFLNPVSDTDTGNTADRRRSNSINYLQNVIQDLYGSNALSGVDTFSGIVIFVGEKQVGLSTEKDAILEEYAKRSPAAAAWEAAKDLFGGDKAKLTGVYKVYIPELECRPVPKSFDDPVILTYYDVYLAEGATGDDPVLGSVVRIKFGNINTFTGPKIISVGKTVAFTDIDAAGNRSAHGSGPSSPAGSYPSSGGTNPPPANFPAKTAAATKEAAKRYDDDPDVPNKSQHTKYLNSLHPDFAYQVKNFIYDAWKNNDATIRLNSGYRSSEKQARVYNQWVANGRRGPKPAAPGSSYHNLGMAIDFNPTVNGKRLMSYTKADEWHASGIVVTGEQNGLYWGGRFSTNYDPIHFDFRNTLPRHKRAAHQAAATAAGVSPNRQPLA